MDSDLLITVVGWIGGLEVILAYALISAKKIDASSLAYQLLNLTGSLFLIVLTVYKQAYASAFVNVVWAVIAVFAIYKYRGK